MKDFGFPGTGSFFTDSLQFLDVPSALGSGSQSYSGSVSGLQADHQFLDGVDVGISHVRFDGLIMASTSNETSPTPLDLADVGPGVPIERSGLFGHAANLGAGAFGSNLNAMASGDGHADDGNGNGSAPDALVADTGAVDAVTSAGISGVDAATSFAPSCLLADAATGGSPPGPSMRSRCLRLTVPRRVNSAGQIRPVEAG